MAKESQGIISYIATTTAESTSTVLGDVVGFTGPGLTAAVIDVTNLVSTAKDKLMGVYDTGQVTLNINAVVTDAGQTKAREMMAARTKGNLMIQLSTASTTQKISMKGYVSALSFAGSVDNKLSGDITFALTAASFST